jgi:hypothetical protein
VDRDREYGLKKLKTFRKIKLTSLEREQTWFRRKKYDPQHPRVKETARKIIRSKDAVKALELEIENAEINVAEPDSAAWMTHGRVLSKDGKGIKGLTVSYFDESARWVRPAGFVCTDARGYFSLIYIDEKGEGKEISDKQPLYLTVTDSKQKALYRDPLPLFKQIGLVDSRVVVLGDGDKIGTPPESGAPPEPPEKPEPQEKDGKPDIWIVRGTVRDPKGKPAGGLLLSLYDKDLFFDDRLGTTETNEKGEFAFRYKTIDFSDLFEAKPDLYIKITSGKRVLYNGKHLPRYDAGREEIFKIKLEQSV